MYILFKKYGWNPKKFWDMTDGEKVVTKAFVSKLADEKEEEYKREMYEIQKARM